MSCVCSSFSIGTGLKFFSEFRAKVYVTSMHHALASFSHFSIRMVTVSRLSMHEQLSMWHLFPLRFMSIQPSLTTMNTLLLSMSIPSSR
ncbi:unknown [Prevotella sp. CAG:255]|nr:unknown [Prevotella sp. CAG:255]